MCWSAGTSLQSVTMVMGRIEHKDTIHTYKVETYPHKKQARVTPHHQAVVWHPHTKLHIHASPSASTQLGDLRHLCSSSSQYGPFGSRRKPQGCSPEKQLERAKRECHVQHQTRGYTNLTYDGSFLCGLCCMCSLASRSSAPSVERRLQFVRHSEVLPQT